MHALIAAADRLLPTPETLAAHADEPDGEPINLVTTWGAVRQLRDALAPHTADPEA